MIPKVYTAHLNIHHFKLPYLPALRAMAFADLKFSLCREYLRNWGFYVPNRRISADAYSKFKHKFECYRDEAIRASNRYGTISTTKSIDRGVFPLRDWLVRDKENLPVASGELPREERIMYELLTDIYAPPLRKAVCVLAWKGYPAEQIAHILQHDPRAPATRWTLEHVQYFLKFFWDISEMSQRDWQIYATMQEIPPEDPHYEYLEPIIKNVEKGTVSWNAYPVVEMDVMEMMDIVLKQQFQDVQNAANKEFRLRAARAFRETASAIKKIEFDKSQLQRMPDENPLQDVELVIRRVRGEDPSPFKSASELDGEISDPFDVSFDKDEFLEQQG